MENTNPIAMDDLLTQVELDAEKVNLMLFNAYDYFCKAHPSEEDHTRIRAEYHNIQVTLETALHFILSIREEVAEAQDDEPKNLVG